MVNSLLCGTPEAEATTTLFLRWSSAAGSSMALQPRCVRCARRRGAAARRGRRALCPHCGRPALLQPRETHLPRLGAASRLQPVAHTARTGGRKCVRRAGACRAAGGSPIRTPLLLTAPNLIMQAYSSRPGRSAPRPVARAAALQAALQGLALCSAARRVHVASRRLPSRRWCRWRAPLSPPWRAGPSAARAAGRGLQCTQPHGSPSRGMYAGGSQDGLMAQHMHGRKTNDRSRPPEVDAHCTHGRVQCTAPCSRT